MNKLFLVKSHANIDFLRSWGLRHQLWRPKADFGYVIHGLLNILFRGFPPNSFYFDQVSGDLHFYTRFNKDHLDQHLARKNREACNGLGFLSSCRGYDVSDISLLIENNQKHSFQIQIPPIQHQSHTRREMDVFSAAQGSRQERQDAYTTWIVNRLTNSGLCDVQIDDVAIGQSKVLRKGARSLTSRTRDEVIFDLSVATFTGSFVTPEKQCFLRTLLNGVGKHKAFGFGMLLIKS